LLFAEAPEAMDGFEAAMALSESFSSCALSLLVRPLPYISVYNYLLLSLLSYSVFTDGSLFLSFRLLPFYFCFHFLFLPSFLISCIIFLSHFSLLSLLLLLSDDLGVIGILSERRVLKPRGLNGGKDAKRGRNLLIR